MNCLARNVHEISLFQFFKMTVMSIDFHTMWISTLIRIAIYHGFNIIYSLIYSPFYSRMVTHRKGLLMDCCHLVCIVSCVYLLPSLLSCVYEASPLLVPCFGNEGSIFKQLNFPEPLYNYFKC
jgi:hypothetical protein